MGAQVVRKTVTNMLGSKGTHLLSTAGLFLLKRVAPKLIPGVNVISTAYDIYDTVTTVHGFLKESGFYTFLKSTAIKAVSYAKNEKGDEVKAVTVQDPNPEIGQVIVMAARTTGTFWEYLNTVPTTVGRFLVDATAIIGQWFEFDPERGPQRPGGALDLAPTGGRAERIEAYEDADGSVVQDYYTENTVQGRSTTPAPAETTAR